MSWLDGPHRSARIPGLAWDELDEERRGLVEQLRDGPRGGFGGPFVPLLRTPRLLSSLQGVGVALRYEEERLSAAVRELTILSVAAWWRQRFEWEHHLPLALAAGIDESATRAIAEGRDPQFADPVLQAVHRGCVGVLSVGEADPEAFDVIRATVGDDGVIEWCCLLGYYSTLAFVMNVAGVPGVDYADPQP